MPFLPSGFLAFRGAATSATAQTIRDRGILKLIKVALDGTGQFEKVTTSGLPEEAGQSASNLALAGLELAAFSEITQANDYHAVPQQRSVDFLLYIHVRHPEPDTRDDLVDYLQNVAANAINGQPLGGVTYADWTRLGRGQWMQATGTERRLVCRGTFVYDIPDYAAHDDTP
jgi:hypothetical protein